MIDFTVSNWRKSQAKPNYRWRAPPFVEPWLNNENHRFIIFTTANDAHRHLMTYSDLEKRNIKILKKNNTLAREPTLSKNPMEPSFGEMLTFPWWRCGSSPMTAWRRSQCSAVKALFSTKTTKKRSVADPARTRTWNPLIRSQMPYPSGHGAFPRIKAIVKAKKLHSEF